MSSLVVKLVTWAVNADTWSDKVSSLSVTSFSVASIIGNVIRLVSRFTCLDNSVTVVDNTTVSSESDVLSTFWGQHAPGGPLSNSVFVQHGECFRW